MALAQLGSSDDKNDNLQRAGEFMRRAAEMGASLTVFPEVFMSHFPEGTELCTIRHNAESIDGAFVDGMRGLAHEHHQWVVFGMNEAPPDAEEPRVFNSTLIANADGDLVGVYRKTHLYDAFGAKESDRIRPGDSLFEPIDTPFGKLGLFVCYELRFPEIARYQALRGADVIVVPSGWVRGPMKEYHWKTLVTARAIENTVFILACDQVSDHYCGQSLVVDPMGVPLASAGEEECLVVCDIDLDRIRSVRGKLPSSKHRREELFSSALGHSGKG